MKCVKYLGPLFVFFVAGAAIELAVQFGCNHRTPAEPRNQWSATVAVEAAEAAMGTASVPAPAPAPEPEPDVGALPGGPLDTFRDARALIEKGNALADRGKSILDAAERDGKISIDVKLPKPPAQQPPNLSLKPPVKSGPEAGASRPDCPGGVCGPESYERRGLFRRWR